jgi:hypothetical protein
MVGDYLPVEVDVRNATCNSPEAAPAELYMRIADASQQP